MIGVDKIGQIRRAFFEQHLPIKEIVRTLSVSRATVRKVIRGKATSSSMSGGFSRRRSWASSDRDPGERSQAAAAGAPIDPAAVRRVARARLRRPLTRVLARARQRAPARKSVAERAGTGSGTGVRAAELRARRGIPVRLEPRDDHAPGPAADHQGGAHRRPRSRAASHATSTTIWDAALGRRLYDEGATFKEIGGRVGAAPPLISQFAARNWPPRDKRPAGRSTLPPLPSLG
jgi:hypothetical protein